MLKAVLLASLAGCAIVPATRTSTRSLGLRDGAVVEGADRGLVLTAVARGGLVTLQASHRLAASVNRRGQRGHALSPSRGSRPDDPRARFFGAVVAPIVVPVSLFVSFGVVAASDDEVTQQVRLNHTVALSCTKSAAHEAIDIALPSGATRRVLTDTTGAATLDIPDSEPYRGTVVAHDGTTQTE